MSMRLPGTGGVTKSTLPAQALLARYREAGAYTDCFVVEAPARISHAMYVAAFYTTWAFRLERLILAVFVAKPSTDGEVERLANGDAQRFAAWTVEARATDQLLLCDFMSRTRSWLMVESFTDADRTTTRLYFGSAIVPVQDRKTGERRLGAGFSALLGFHKVYSRILLSAARSRALRKSRQPGPPLS